MVSYARGVLNNFYFVIVNDKFKGEISQNL